MDKLMCDCYGCWHEASWRQKIGDSIINLCYSHHGILRTKVPQNVKLDNDVLKWLLAQSPNYHNVANYSIFLVAQRTFDHDYKKE